MITPSTRPPDPCQWLSHVLVKHPTDFIDEVAWRLIAVAATAVHGISPESANKTLDELWSKIPCVGGCRS